MTGVDRPAAAKCDAGCAKGHHIHAGYNHLVTWQPAVHQWQCSCQTCSTPAVRPTTCVCILQLCGKHTRPHPVHGLNTTLPSCSLAAQATRPDSQPSPGYDIQAAVLWCCWGEGDPHGGIHGTAIRPEGGRWVIWLAVAVGWEAHVTPVGVDKPARSQQCRYRRLRHCADSYCGEYVQQLAVWV